MFSNFKEGDEVFIRRTVEISGGWNPILIGEFFIPRVITRTTPKFVCVGKNAFSKVDGKMRGENSWIYMKGDIVGQRFGIGQVEVIDQSVQYQKALAKVENVNLVRMILDTRSLRYNIDWKNATEEQLYAVIKAVESLPKVEK